MDSISMLKVNYPSISIKTYLCLHADLFIRSAYQIGHANYDKLHAINTMLYHINMKDSGFED